MAARREAQDAEQFTISLPDMADPFRVTRVKGTESLNSTYRFDVEVVTTADADIAARLLETPATLMMQFGGVTARTVHGIVSACRAIHRTDAGATSYALRIVPRMRRLKKRRTSRVFQDKTTREIIEGVLAISGIANDFRLQRSSSKRPYCVQYDESDYAFVTRLAAADGIFFSFEHPLGEPTERVVFSDNVDAYSPIDGGGELRFRALSDDGSALVGEEDHIHTFDLRHAMRSTRVLLRRFDFERPPIPLRDVAGLDLGAKPEDAEGMRAFVDTGATVYEHQQSREQALLEPIGARTALEAERQDAALARGTTACRRLLPGRRFHLVDHPVSELDGEYVVVSCSHEGRAPQTARLGQAVYANSFVAVSSDVPFRPERPRRRVRQSLETATVVGPLGEEVHTDEHGRVRVQFHWDLQGQLDDKASCWLRVLQPWAGAGYGAQFLPRIGHEVVVAYIDGDTDRPIILGSVHNGLQATPFSFPREKTQSGIKTLTSPGGTGGHELVFEDRAGAEFVAMRSTRTLHVSAAEDSTVSAARNLSITAGADRRDEVLGDASTTIAGEESRTTGGGRSALVGGSDALEVKGDRDSRVGGNDVVRIDGASLLMHSGSRSTIIGTSATDPADETVGVTGQYRVASGQEMRISSGKGIEIACGDSKIIVQPHRIIIQSPTIQLQAMERIALVQGDPPQATLTLAGSASLGGGTVSVVGGGKGGGKLFLDSEAHLDGALVKLNCAPAGGAGGERIGDDHQKGSVAFTVSPDGVPQGVQSVTLVIATPTGDVVERVCAVGGTAVMEGSAGDVFTVVETRVGDKKVALQKKVGAPDSE